MSKTLSYEEVDKKQLVDWIELCHDLFDEKKVKDNEHGALYSVFGRLGIYVKENEARIAALESRLREAEAVIKPFAELFPHLVRRMGEDENGTYYEISSGGLPDAKITLAITRRAAAFLAGGDTNKV